MRGLMSRFSFKQSKNFVFPTTCVLTPQNTDVRKLSNKRHADGVPFSRPKGALSCRILPSAKQAGQALRRAPHKIPRKSPAPPDFCPSARAVRTRGGYRFRFLRNRKRIQGGQPPPWTFEKEKSRCKASALWKFKYRGTSSSSRSIWLFCVCPCSTRSTLSARPLQIRTAGTGSCRR